MEIVFVLIAVLVVDAVLRVARRARRQHPSVCFSRPPRTPLSTL